MSVNQSALRDINTGLMLRLIMENPMISRTELAEKSGLAASTVTHIIHDLQKRNFIRECGQALSRRGRRPVLLKIFPQGGYFVGVELTAPTSRIGILNLANELVLSRSFVTPIGSSDAAYLMLVEQISDAVNWCKRQGMQVLGIGVGATGLVDSVKGKIVESTSLGWNEFPLLERLGRIFDYPMTIQNEANAAAVGEYARGKQSGSMENMMYVAVGSGIGCGIILHGNLYTGAQGMAGEIGHITVDPEGPKCRCGKRGCLEQVASGDAMLRRFVGSSGAKDMGSPEAFIAAAEAGNVEAKRMVLKAGEAIGTAIGNQVNVLNLDTVIVGGALLHPDNMFFAAIRKAAFEAVLPVFRERLEIHISSLKNAAGVVGAATLSWKRLFG